MMCVFTQHIVPSVQTGLLRRSGFLCQVLCVKQRGRRQLTFFIILFYFKSQLCSEQRSRVETVFVKILPFLSL